MTLPAESTQRQPVESEASRISFADLLGGTGVALAGDQVGQLAGYRDLLFEYNQVTNLTAVRDLPGIERRLIVESLRLVPPILDLPGIDVPSRRSLIDIGTGGGLPGIVLAISCPDLNVFLLDATGKKVAFLDMAIARLGLTNATAIHARAEEIGHQARYRGAFDIVTARAVASVPVLLELGLPLLRTGGHLLLPKGVDIAEELDEGSRAAEIIGGAIESHGFLPDVGSTVETRLVIARKTAATPATYPRRAGIPAKQPLRTAPATAANGFGRSRGRNAP